MAQHLSCKKIDKKYFSVKFKLQKDDKKGQKSFPQKLLRFTQAGHYEYKYLVTK